MLNIKVYGVSGDFIVRGRAVSVSTKVLAALIICKDSTPECVDKKTRLRIYRVQKNPSYYSKESVAYAHIIRNLPFRGLLISTQSSMRMAFLSIFTTSTWLLQKQFFVTPLRFHLELGLWRCTITTPVWNIFQKNIFYSSPADSVLIIHTIHFRTRGAKNHSLLIWKLLNDLIPPHTKCASVMSFYSEVWKKFISFEQTLQNVKYIGYKWLQKLFWLQWVLFSSKTNCYMGQIAVSVGAIVFDLRVY